MTPSRPSQVHDVARWVVSAGLVVALHAILAVSFLAEPRAVPEAPWSGALVIELAPIAVAKIDPPADLAPGPEQVQASASPDAASLREEMPDLEPPGPEPTAEPVTEHLRAPDPDPLPVATAEDRKAPIAASPPPSHAAPVTSASQV